MSQHWSESELEFLRGTQELHMPEEVHISREVKTPDGRGGLISSWTEQGHVNGRISVLSAQEAELYSSRFGANTAYRLTLPSPTEIKVGDHVTLRDVSYGITGIETPNSYETALKTYVRQL